MKILGLPGRNPQTGPWMEKVLKAIDVEGSEKITQYYAAWKSGGSQADPKQEVDIAASHKPDLIVAKSIGSVIAVNAITKDRLSPKYQVFIGVPFKGLGEPQRKLFLDFCNREKPTLFIQQANDPAGAYAVMAEHLPKSEFNTLKEVPGADHKYDDVEQLGSIISEWIKGLKS